MLTTSYTSNKTNVIYNLKQILLLLYTEENLNYIVSNLNNKFESFPITFDISDYSIHIRLKKSFINKVQHNPIFYYKYLSDIFINLFTYNIDFIKTKYIELFGNNGFEFVDEFCTLNYFHLINILTIGDTNIIIKLI